MSDMISRQEVLKLLHALPPEEAMTKAMLIQSVKQMDSETVTECNDLISRRAALKALKKNRFPGAHYIDTGVKIALREIKALPSAQLETADCIYCHEDSDGYVNPIEKNCHAFIRFGMNGWEISLSAKGWNGSAKIMYCPMCGRRLNE